MNEKRTKRIDAKGRKELKRWRKIGRKSDVAGNAIDLCFLYSIDNH